MLRVLSYTPFPYFPPSSEAGPRTMRALGIDPDSATTAWALCADSPDGVVLEACGLIESNRKIWGDARTASQMQAIWRAIPDHVPLDQADMVLIEDQHERREGVKMANIFKVAHVAGALRGRCLEFHDRVTMLSPEIWTGGFAKPDRMLRIPHLLGVSLEEIAAMAECSLSDANHVVDAAGIARWWLDHRNDPVLKLRAKPRRRRGGRKRY